MAHTSVASTNASLFGSQAAHRPLGGQGPAFHRSAIMSHNLARIPPSRLGFSSQLSSLCNAGNDHRFIQSVNGGVQSVKPRSVCVHAVWSNWQKQKKEEEKGDERRLVIVDGAAALKDKEDGDNGREDEKQSITVSVVPAMSLIPAADWDLCAVEAAGGEAKRNPFVSHAFLQCLEDSRSAVREEGWMPQHLVAKDSSGEIVGVVPLYLKGHSYGEYVFDHSWASAFMRYGGSYYPKLQSCVPFTPVTGPRLMVRQTDSDRDSGSGRDSSSGDRRDGDGSGSGSSGGSSKRGGSRVTSEAVVGALCEALKQVAEQYGVSSAHVTFSSQAEWQAMAAHGFLQRLGMQYHWTNKGYSCFNDFLMDLKQSKRKNIRQERKKVVAQGLTLSRLRGADIKSDHWDSFFNFYRNTTDNKWGQAYLTRDFFHQLGPALGDSVLLVTAHDSTDRMVAGALNLVGGDALYGRNWGCQPNTHFPFLHFEACYYQAIEAAIEAGLSRVEAGAQGEHKLARGYLPVPTFSAHYITDASFRSAVADFVKRETVQMKLALAVVDKEANPFKEGGGSPLTILE